MAVDHQHDSNCSERGSLTNLDRGEMESTIGAMMEDLQRGRPEVQPSRYWVELNKINKSQLLDTGLENFKRTVVKNYFTWTKFYPWDAQVWFLIMNLPLWVTLRNMIQTFFPLKHRHIPLFESWACNFLSRMVWDYAYRTSPALKTIGEPELGNPPRILRKGRLISQDLANSVIEYDSILSGISEPGGVTRIAELGAGYGRNAYVFLKLAAKKTRYVVIDIPPALYIAQQYLSALFPERKVFRYRPFGAYASICGEFESSDLAFLLPSQIELLPEGSFDLFVNISSLQEMRKEQIDYYFKEIRRLVRPEGYFFLKEWKVSRIPFENVVIREDDYPVSGWRAIFKRNAPVQKKFFEALLQKPVSLDESPKPRKR